MVKNQKPVRVPKASDIIADRIRSLIIKGELKPGDSMPSEVQLMEQLGASRRALREALRVLESERFISIRRGARTGAKIHRPDASMVARYAGYVLQANGATLSSLYLARSAIAPYIVRLLAEESDAQTVKCLAVRIEKIKSLYDQGAVTESREIGTQFELFMAELLGNRALTLIYTMIEHLIESYQLRYKMPPTLTNEAEVEKAVRWWHKSAQRLLVLLERGDASSAERHWRKHLSKLDEIWRYDQEKMLRVIIS